MEPIKTNDSTTLSNDQLSDKKFHYGLANPPFGIKWDKDKSAVEKEHKEMGYAGRFGPGLPRISDGSMLFLMHLVSKMEAPENGGGRVGIILSGSPLFTGDAGSGESEIRRWLLEQDLVEAIIALPADMFFNTEGFGKTRKALANAFVTTFIERDENAEPGLSKSAGIVVLLRAFAIEERAKTG